MNCGKYIIIKQSGLLIPILFHETISHDNFLKCYSKNNIRSAGFFQVILQQCHDSHKITVHVFGRSSTLKISTHCDDSLLIQHLLETT